MLSVPVMRRMACFLSQSMPNKRFVLFFFSWKWELTLFCISHPHPVGLFSASGMFNHSVKGQGKRTDCDLVTQQNKDLFIRRKGDYNCIRPLRYYSPKTSQAKCFTTMSRLSLQNGTIHWKMWKSPSGWVTFLTQRCQCSQWNDFSSGHSSCIWMCWFLVEWSSCLCERSLKYVPFLQFFLNITSGDSIQPSHCAFI